MHSHFSIKTDHFQFYFGDRNLGPSADTQDLWTAGEKIASLANLVGVTTARYGGTTSIVIVLGEDDATHGNWTEKLGETSVAVPSGQGILWAPEDDDLRTCPLVTLEPGSYRCRVFARNTAAVEDEMDEEGPDEYALFLTKDS